MNIKQTVQVLEPGAKIELYVLDASSLGGPVLRFHRYTQTSSIWWQGLEYLPWPIKAEGFARTSSGEPNPTVTVSNLDRSVTVLCISYKDLVSAVFTRLQTFGRYLDTRNFAGNVNPTADPTQQLPPEIWFVERKISESIEEVSFELASAMDFNAMSLPGRQIIANKCSWLTKGGYRGAYCGYSGPAVAKYDDTATAVLAEDKCGGRVASCQLRFGTNNPLPYGSFPAASLTR